MTKVKNSFDVTELDIRSHIACDVPDSSEGKDEGQNLTGDGRIKQLQCITGAGFKYSSFKQFNSFGPLIAASAIASPCEAGCILTSSTWVSKAGLSIPFNILLGEEEYPWTPKLA